MKKILIIISFLALITKVFSQSQGIGYQAVLINDNEKEIPGIDVEGNYLPNQQLTIRFSILNNLGDVDYQEEHNTSTDKYGMINVTIGWGEATAISPGLFTDIDWDGSPKDLRVEISLGLNNEEFEEFAFEQLKFVPYAFHRNITATGTMDIEGATNLNDELHVNNASSTYLSGELNVELNTALNSDLQVNNGSSTYLTGDLTTDGETNLNSNFSVNNASSSYLSGSLEVDEHTHLNSSLNVNNSSPTNLSGTLSVDQETNLNDNLYVNNGNETHLSGELIVQGESTLSNVTLTTLNSTSNQSDYVATFENTNNGNGDGIKIKLGKRATKNNTLAENADEAISLFLGEVNLTEFEFVTGILDGDLNTNDMTKLIQQATLTAEDAQALAATVCDLSVRVGNSIISEINSLMGLPYRVGPWGVHVPVPINKTLDVVPEVTVMPALPTIPTAACDFLGEGFQLPNLELSDVYVTNPLNSENHFIHFTDNDDFTMGAIKAQSIENWALQYLDIVFLYELYSTFKGIDKAEIMPELNVLGKDVAASYLDIGVSYSSGNGDYSEWLERLDPKEKIGAGDIVGVKGGKITKDLQNAEQVMAISHRPIVLGNIPESGKEYLGNNVAFMGQIPVKITGPVHSGDFIVGTGNIPGYGIAVRPEDMNLEHLKNCVGRSWEENLSDESKMVNTVVGLQNGDYINILKKYEQQTLNNEMRIKELEEKLDLLINSFTSKTK